jgi:glycosyltransferase involved in cell wall biosynthesis
MKILLTTDVFPPGGGGSGQSTAALARALVRRGHEITVVVSKRNVSGELRRDWEGVAVIEVGVGRAKAGRSGRETRLARFIKDWAPEEKFDLAHAQHWLSAKATIDAFSTLNLPVVVTVRDYWPVCIWSTKLSGQHRCPGCSFVRRIVCVGRRRPVLWPLAPLLPVLVELELTRRRKTLEKAAAVVAVSEHVKRSLPVDRAEVIPNLVDLSEIKKKLKGESFPELPDRFALFVGKLEPNKAPDRLIPILKASGVRLPLVVAGSGSLEKKLREEGSRFEGDVHFKGWVEAEETLRLMSRATAVVFPSRWDEPLSRVLLEGLGAGAVLLVQPTGGSEDIVVHGESGLLGRSIEELGDTLRRVVEEDGLSTRLRQGALERAEEVFSKDVVLPRYEALYERVTRKGARP